ncbi:hypothetical protein Pint_06507 [Pistacia integerrima]|uniref:Uncharacterized protein n=1 Tax=Pistacia integerrima TaxID=434235 RepID=A0ACC0Z1X7_9ROSI|nr:hypothetical protein Pint_06507 [Pistacia integerrima]
MLNDCIIIYYVFGGCSQVEEGAKVEQPFWLAQELYLRQTVSINVPTCFNQRTRREIQADAESVDLRSKVSIFLQIWLIGDRTSGKMLLSTFRMRYKDFIKAHTVAYAVASKFLMVLTKEETNREIIFAHLTTYLPFSCHIYYPY